MRLCLTSGKLEVVCLCGQPVSYNACTHRHSTEHRCIVTLVHHHDAASQLLLETVQGSSVCAAQVVVAGDVLEEQCIA